jgi:hypothetical protein
VIILRYISADSDSGITRVHFSSERGAHSPRGVPDTLAEGPVSHQDQELEQGAPFGTFSGPF